MTLNLRIISCLVCAGDCSAARDRLLLDDLDENGGRSMSWMPYVLPPARYRDRVAPDICDACWLAHKTDMVQRASHRRYGGYMPFRAVYLWAWVAEQFAKEAETLGREARRLTSHLAEKAARGNGVIRKGPLREYGPRRFVYRRTYA